MVIKSSVVWTTYKLSSSWLKYKTCLRSRAGTATLGVPFRATVTRGARAVGVTIGTCVISGMRSLTAAATKPLIPAIQAAVLRPANHLTTRLTSPDGMRHVAKVTRVCHFRRHVIKRDATPSDAALPRSAHNAINTVVSKNFFLILKQSSGIYYMESMLQRWVGIRKWSLKMHSTMVDWVVTTW